MTAPGTDCAVTGPNSHKCMEYPCGICNPPRCSTACPPNEPHVHHGAPSKSIEDLLAARTAEALEVACGDKCSTCAGGSKVERATAGAREWVHQNGFVCKAASIRSAFLARWGAKS